MVLSLFKCTCNTNTNRGSVRQIVRSEWWSGFMIRRQFERLFGWDPAQNTRVFVSLVSRNLQKCSASECCCPFLLEISRWGLQRDANGGNLSSFLDLRNPSLVSHLSQKLGPTIQFVVDSRVPLALLDLTVAFLVVNRWSNRGNNAGMLFSKSEEVVRRIHRLASCWAASGNKLVQT
jgi:hypothetical protein